ncbi:hypothetical protein RFI_01482, partial [Reticulomyxa filosa]
MLRILPQKTLTGLLLQYFDKYLKGIEADLRLSLWGGDVILENVELRLNVLNEELKMGENFDNPWQITKGFVLSALHSRQSRNEGLLKKSQVHHHTTIIRRANSKSADNTEHMEDEDEETDDVDGDDHEQDEDELANDKTGRYSSSKSSINPKKKKKWTT